MTFPTKLLCPGEEIHLDSRPNWSLCSGRQFSPCVVIGACVAVGVLWTSAPAYMAWVLLGCGLAALLYFGVCYLAWVTTSFVVTSQRIVYRTGVLQEDRKRDPYRSRAGRDLPPDDRRTGREGRQPHRRVRRASRTGSLSGHNQASRGAVAYQPGRVPAAGYPAGRASELEQDVAPNAISEPKRTRRRERSMRPRSQIAACMSAACYRQAASQPPGPQSGVPTTHMQVAPQFAQQMGELADLHRHGVITDAEYEQKRRELLDRL